MALFGDFEFTGPVPASSSWSVMGSQVQFKYPAPAAMTSPPCPYPHTLAVETTGISSAALQWRMAMVGYGDFSLYGTNWLIKSIKLNSAEISDLKRLAKARTAIVNRAYIILPASTIAPMRIVPRSIYPLIDPSEQVNISYALGCAMAEASAASAIATRSGATGTLTHLFHKRLLEVGSLSTQLVQVEPTKGKAIDFIGFEGKTAKIHLVEAKGTGGSFDYPALHKGLLQCESVTGVSIAMLPAVMPTSLNVSCSYVAHTRVNCGIRILNTSVRTALFSFLPARQVTPLSGGNNILIQIGRAVNILFGAKMVGLYMALLGAETQETYEEWQLFTYLVDPPDVQGQNMSPPIVVALPTKMWTKIEELWTDSQKYIEAAKRLELISKKLENNRISKVVLPDEHIQEVLYRFGSELLTNQILWSNLVAPAQMRVDAFEPWLAFQNDSSNV